MIGAIITGFVAIALGFYIARLWGPSASWALLIGLMCGGVCAIVYFGASVLTGQLVPHSMDPRQIGYWFKIVIFAAPVAGALGGFLGYRRAPEFQQD
jgi:ABC-type transporter Mla maintaining outer membrane lipid asymmetry permease subunit MlaE